MEALAAAKFHPRLLATPLLDIIRMRLRHRIKLQATDNNSNRLDLNRASNLLSVLLCRLTARYRREQSCRRPTARVEAHAASAAMIRLQSLKLITVDR